jgi:N-acyl-D-amino-acid deacylase
MREAADRLNRRRDLFMMDEKDVQSAMTLPGDDRLGQHPLRRIPSAPVGDFPRVLGHYSRDLKLFRWRTPCGTDVLFGAALHSKRGEIRPASMPTSASSIRRR